MKPRISILDRAFAYKPSYATAIAETWRRFGWRPAKRNARWPEIPISLEDAARATSSQVFDIVRYAKQSNPQLVDALLAALLQDGVTMTALGVSVAAITIKHVSDRRGWKPESSIKK